MTAAKRGRQRPASSGLDLYRDKRDFTKTREPAGGRRPGESGTLRFVIQKHAARNMHFDLRLQLDGVMKSWAVPKGPSLDPSVKRLAMPVEDHPIEYNTFEGTIPQGEYGGGTVMLWDRGTYGPDVAIAAAKAPRDDAEDTLRDAYERGDLKFVLHGQRLRGSWVLVRTRAWRGASSARPQWLLIKHRDAFARPGSDIVAEVTTSVATGRTMDEIAAADERDAPPSERVTASSAVPRQRRGGAASAGGPTRKTAQRAPRSASAQKKTAPTGAARRGTGARPHGRTSRQRP